MYSLIFGILMLTSQSNVPIGALVFILLLLFLDLKASENENRKKPLKQKLEHMDFGGCLTLIGAVCCLLLALQWGGQTMPWSSSHIWGLFIGFALLLSIFSVLQWRLGEKATIPLRILRQRSILAGSGVLFFLGASLYLVRV